MNAKMMLSASAPTTLTKNDIIALHNEYWEEWLINEGLYPDVEAYMEVDYIDPVNGYRNFEELMVEKVWEYIGDNEIFIVNMSQE